MAEIVFPHQFHDGTNETASGVQVMENLNKLKEETEKLVRDATHEMLRVQIGVYAITPFGGGPWSFEITLPFAWPTAHLVFLSGNLTSPTANEAWLTGSEAIGLAKGKIKGPSGPPGVAANVPWVSVGL